jgi:hypothetical protein
MKAGALTSVGIKGLRRLRLSGALPSLMVFLKAGSRVADGARERPVFLASPGAQKAEWTPRTGIHDRKGFHPHRG